MMFPLRSQREGRGQGEVRENDLQKALWTQVDSEHLRLLTPALSSSEEEWIKDSQKMIYKQNFQPQEKLIDDEWVS